jgi:hypothetical protein
VVITEQNSLNIVQPENKSTVQSKKPVTKTSQQQDDIIDLFDQSDSKPTELPENKIKDKSTSGDIDLFFDNINLSTSNTKTESTDMLSSDKDKDELFNFVAKPDANFNVIATTNVVNPIQSNS